MQCISRGNSHVPLMHHFRHPIMLCTSSGYHAETSVSRPDSTHSMRESLRACRIPDALGHSRGHRCCGSTRAAQDTAAASLWGSGGRLLLWHLSSSVCRQAHDARSPQGRSACGRRPAGDGFDHKTTYGGDGVVSRRFCCTFLQCRRADQAVEASAADCFKILVGRSSTKLHCSWHAALDASSGPEAPQLIRTTSRGPARSQMGASAHPLLRQSSFRNST